MGGNDGADYLQGKVFHFLEANTGFPHGEFLSCTLKGSHQCLIDVLIHVGGHEIEGVVLLLNCQTYIAQWFLIVGVGIQRKRDFITEHAPVDRLHQT